MLDKKAELVLKILCKECDIGYKVIEFVEILTLLSEKKIGISELKKALKQLHNSSYINIKYEDAKVVCLAILPFGRQVIEKYELNAKEESSLKHYLVKSSIILFIVAIVGSFLGTLFYNLMF